MPEPTEQQLLLNSAEVASRLRIGKTLLYELKSQGKLPMPVRLGRRLLWPKDEIERWVRAGCPPTQKWEILKKDRNFPFN